MKQKSAETDYVAHKFDKVWVLMRGGCPVDADESLDTLLRRILKRTYSLKLEVKSKR